VLVLKPHYVISFAETAADPTFNHFEADLAVIFRMMPRTARL
jgi:hypothetical protein